MTESTTSNRDDRIRRQLDGFRAMARQALTRAKAERADRPMAQAHKCETCGFTVLGACPMCTDRTDTWGGL